MLQSAKSMHKVISRWILEFFLRQSIDDNVLDTICRVLPLPEGDSSFKICMLLRRIQSEIAHGLVSEEILELMQQIGCLRYRDGVGVPESIKAAFCAVAVNCTVRFLEGDGDDKEVKYFEAVKKIWKDGVCKLEKTELNGLFSEELRNWGDEIEAAIWDSSVHANLLLKSKENDALELVRVFVAEAWEKQGPPYLEVLADSLKDIKVREVLGLPNGVSEDSEAVAQDSPVINKDKDKGKKIGSPKQKHVARSRHTTPIKAGTSRGARITDNEELAADKSEKYGFPQTPEINKIQEALKSSTMELKAVINDPLPNALNVAETLVSEMARNKENVNPPNPSDDNNPKRKPNQNLMEPNSTARIDEWNDSIDESWEECDESSEEWNKFSLPTPKKRVVSPLKKHEMIRLYKRRKVRKWSKVEEETLRTGVEKYGHGKWKLILLNYGNIFGERTEVDLKDKWRNMVK